MKNKKNYLSKKSLILLFTFAAYAYLSAQNTGGGTGGIQNAISALKSYAGPVGNLILAIGGVVGLIGGVRVYIRWNSGARDVQKDLMGWLGSCIFLVLVGTVIKGFFG